MLEVTVHFEGYQVAPFFFDGSPADLATQISTHFCNDKGSHGLAEVPAHDGRWHFINRQKITHISLREVTSTTP